ncbi:MAG: EamA family transporter [Candidatus Eremiobacteraeota bacterium]|nr:EamA family transporter [Candidatus Eremiobacteraeota bacterium]
MKIAVAYAPPFEFAALRAFGGSLLLFAVMIAMRRSLRPQFLWTYLALGFFQTTGFVGLVTWAVVMAGAGKISVLAYSMPLWVALIGWPLLGERLRGIQIVAVLLAMAGILCIFDIAHPGGSLFADLLAVAAGISWAIGVIVAKRLQRSERVDLLSLTTWQMFFGGAFLVLIALIVPGHATQWVPAYVGALAYNIVFATAIAYVLWLFVLDTLPARDASMGTLTNPLIGIVAAWIQLGERPSVTEGAGMLLVIAGLAVLSLAPARK